MSAIILCLKPVTFSLVSQVSKFSSMKARESGAIMMSLKQQAKNSAWRIVKTRVTISGYVVTNSS